MKLLVTTMALFALSHTAVADWLGPEGKDTDRYAPRNLEKILAANPPGENEDIKVTPLYESPRSKHVLVQVRDREPPHIHADSDITVWLLRGHGVLHVAGKEHPVKAGDVIHVPRDVVHYFVNRGFEVAAALVVYSPVPGPDDRVPVRVK
jgi:mannose-6-phosphate isomerase-like protein (cupin superfamily)